jgi:hypothetical protein
MIFVYQLILLSETQVLCGYEDRPSSQNDFVAPRYTYKNICFLYLVCEAICHSWPIVPASGDSEDDCGEADGM